MHGIITAIKKQLPRFNDELLIDLRKREADGLIDFVAERYRECSIMADPNLEFINYEIVPPIARVHYELTAGMKKNLVNIRADESVLVNYNFRYHDKLFTVPLYIPYLYENSTIVYNGTNYECLLSMTEKLFSIRTSSHGVTIKVIRSPISCWRNTIHPFTDVVSGRNFIGNVVSCKIHYKKESKSTKKLKPTVVHYLLCKYNMPEVLEKFGIAPDAATFVEQETPVEGFYYFKTKNITTAKDQIFLKVNAKVMDENYLLTDTVAAILYFMNGQRFVQFNELIHNPKTVFMILLGKIIYNSGLGHVNAHSYMVKHIESADSYLDNYTKEIFRTNGIIVNDIYEMLIFVTKNISRIIVSCPNNNMYNKRIEIMNSVIIDSFVSALYHRIYKYEKKPDIEHMAKAIVGAFRVSPKFILKNALGKSESVRYNPPVYSDNWLLTIGNKAVKRLNAVTKSSTGGNRKKDSGKHAGSGINAPVNKFHPSMMDVESAIGFSGKPGINCIINPYAEIDATGGFVRGIFAEETAKISEFMLNEVQPFQKGEE